MTFDPTAAVAAARAGRSAGDPILDEPSAQEITRAVGIGVPAMAVVTAGGAPGVALPGPKVVVKGVGPAHKSDVGAVLVVDNTPASIEAAVAAIGDSLGAASPFLVAEWIDHDPATELIAAVRWSAAFGPVVTLGRGGVAVEEEGEPAVVTAATLDRIVATLEAAGGTRSLLAGRRGRPPVATREALVDLATTLLALGEAAMPADLLEFEINPLVITPSGPMALDALAVRGDGTPAPGIRPRPAGAIARQLHPRSIAVMGVSQGMNPGRVILRNLLAAGFPRDRITVIKPGVAAIDGCRAVRDPGSLPEPVDLLVLALDAATATAALESVIRTGTARSVVVIPGGLGEVAGTESAAARIRHGLDGSERPPVVTGPNSMGIRSRPGRYDATFIPPERMSAAGGPEANDDHPIAVIAQSGAFTLSRLDRHPWLRPRYVVSVGNQLDLTVGDYLEHVAADPAVAVAALYVEGIVPGDGDRVLRAAQRMTRRGGMVLWYRGGRSAAGIGAAATHTAVIAGDDLVARRLGAAAGIVEAESLDDFDDLLGVAARFAGRAVDGSRLAIVSNAGFETVAAADRAAALAELAGSTRQHLGLLLGESGLNGLTVVTNPLDLTPMADDATVAAAVEAVLDDPGVDAAVVGCVPFTPALHTLPEHVDDADSLPRRLARLAGHPTPWVAVVDGGTRYEPFRQSLITAGVPVLATMDRAVRVLGRYLERSRS